MRKAPRFPCVSHTEWVVDVILGDGDYRGHAALEEMMNSFCLYYGTWKTSR